jgi:hypothetical protein
MDFLQTKQLIYFLTSDLNCKQKTIEDRNSRTTYLLHVNHLVLNSPCLINFLIFQGLVGCIYSFDVTLIESSTWTLQMRRRMRKVKEIGDVQSASSSNYKTLTLTILNGGGYNFGTKRV